jgi:hypothetical protein
MSQTIRALAVGLAVIGSAALLTPSAHAQKADAVRAADFAARTAVQTIYHNLITNGYEWKWIRDEKMPDILIRAVTAIKQEAGSMDHKLILESFIPTYVSSFYDEIDRINEQHQERCINVTFVVRTLIPFFKECSVQLTDVGTLTEIVVPVLKTEYTIRVCETLAACQEALSDKYFIVFNEKIEPDRFYNVCVGENL